MAVKDFKAIVVGGGPVGLTAAHALDRAGIDFVLLERQPEIVMNAGSNLALSPFGLQSMTQLGLVEALKAVSTPLVLQRRLDHAGEDIGNMVLFEQMQKILGVSSRMISRYDLTGTLFRTLSPEARAKVLPAKILSKIQITTNGVVASCSDGTSYTGDIIIGADGAHSATRELIRTLDDSADQASIEAPFLTTFRCLWIRFPSTNLLPLGASCETHGYGASTQLFNAKESAIMGLYERLPEPSRKRHRYTKADQDDIADRWGHLPLMPNSSVTLRDVYATRIEAGLVSLEEGVVKDWSFAGRVVLVGDAAHKFTPSTGAGCNHGILDVAALIGELAKVLDPDRRVLPDPAVLASAFKAYETSRRPAVEFECGNAGGKTASATWQIKQHEDFDKHVANQVAPQQDLVKRMAEALPKAPAFDFVQKSKQDVERAPSQSLRASIPITVR